MQNECMQITRAVVEDAGAVARVHVDSWRVAYKNIVPDAYLDALSVEARELSWRGTVLAGKPELLLAREDAATVGFIAFGACRDEDAPPGRGEVWAIYVAPSHWSQGIGRELWARANDVLKARSFTSVSLWVLADNARAIRFYRIAGLLPEPSSAKVRVIGGRSLQEIRYIGELSQVP